MRDIDYLDLQRCHRGPRLALLEQLGSTLGLWQHYTGVLCLAEPAITASGNCWPDAYASVKDPFKRSDLFY